MPTANLQPGKPRAFRSYDSARAGANSTTIWEAARATAALPGLFEPVRIGAQGIQESFSGWLGCTNALSGLVKEAEATFGSDQMIAFLLSIGAGQEPIVSLEASSQTNDLNNRMDALSKLSNGADAVADGMESKVGHLNLYIRFNIPHRPRSDSIMRNTTLGTIKTDTENYLTSAAVEKLVGHAVDHLRWPKGVTTLGNISEYSGLD